MQFTPDIDRCIRDPWLVREYQEPRRSELLRFLRSWRRNWHVVRRAAGYAESSEWLKRRGG